MKRSYFCSYPFCKDFRFRSLNAFSSFCEACRISASAFSNCVVHALASTSIAPQVGYSLLTSCDGKFEMSSRASHPANSILGLIRSNTYKDHKIKTLEGKRGPLPSDTDNPHLYRSNEDILLENIENSDSLRLSVHQANDSFSIGSIFE